MKLFLGTAQFKRGYGLFRDIKSEQSPQILLKTATENGFVGLDTAPKYGQAEKIIGEFGWTGELHTKINPDSRPATSVERSMKDLNRDSIDVLYFHDSRIVNLPPREFQKIADELPRDYVSKLGVSVYSPEEALASLRHPSLEVVQIPFSIADSRWTREVLARLAQAGTEVYVRSIFLQGALMSQPAELPLHLKGLVPVIQSLQKVAGQLNISVPEVIFGWLKCQDFISGVIVGAESSVQIRQITTAFSAATIDQDSSDYLRRVGVSDANLVDPRRWDTGFLGMTSYRALK